VSALAGPLSGELLCSLSCFVGHGAAAILCAVYVWWGSLFYSMLFFFVNNESCVVVILHHFHFVLFTMFISEKSSATGHAQLLVHHLVSFGHKVRPQYMS
jgi:hypothetical protein